MAVQTITPEMIIEASTRLPERTPPVLSVDGQQPAAAPQPQTKAPPLAAAGQSGKPLTRPELAYLVGLVVVLLAGFGIASAVDDGTTTWSPGPGISVFAMIFVLTAAIERLLEIFAPFIGTTKIDGGPKSEDDQAAGDDQAADNDARATALAAAAPPTWLGSRATRSQLMRARDASRAGLMNAASDGARTQHLETAAWVDELLIQVRQNASTVWAIGAAIGMALSAGLGVLLLHSLGVTAASRPVDFVITGLVIGGGTKALHELVGNMQASKEAAKDAASS